MRTVKLSYVFNQTEYKLEYDAESNILFAIHTDLKTNTITSIVPTEGELFGKTKFTKETVDEYIDKGKGGFIPVFHPALGFIYSDSDLQSLDEAERNEILQKYPKLIKERIISPDPDNPYLKRVISMVQSVCKYDGTVVKSDVLVDNTAINWWSSADTPWVDIRDHLPQQIADDVIATETTRY